MNDAPLLLHKPFLPLNDFAAETRSSRRKVYRFIAEGRVTAVKNGKSTLIRETPAAFLNSLPQFTPGAMPPGPGRPKRSA